MLVSDHKIDQFYNVRNEKTAQNPKARKMEDDKQQIEDKREKLFGSLVSLNEYALNVKLDQWKVI